MPREVAVKVKVPSHMQAMWRELKLAYAVDLFLRGIVSVERAAELAEMQLYDFILELRKRGLHAYPYSDEELLEELRIE